MSISISITKNFNLKKTLECGQCFRWSYEHPKWVGIVFDFKAYLYVKNENLIIESDNENIDFWKNYFDLNLDYFIFDKEIIKLDPLFENIYREGKGIRILRQDPWEVLCSFIISQNNNIPRIKLIIKKLCENFGNKIKDYFSFPSPKILSQLTEDDLSVIRSGFRAKYLIDAAKKVYKKQVDLEKIFFLNFTQAHFLLRTISGVGPKVSNCVLLYGFHKLEAFPNDVWVQKAIKEFFPHKTSQSFGKYAGIAQIYLYYWIRKKHILDLSENKKT
ncbi:MAG: DNA-3-methyladenine glycosylase 2 family protein [Oscillospiraceae bacterium]|jgi:N-glycosylase/DNA lyase|nr:DNA-3-methyladenine glycosylase 2 family protein [Oscillospiraceae bacterium]